MPTRRTYTFAMARAAAAGFKAAGLSLAVQNFAVGGGRTLPTTGPFYHCRASVPFPLEDLVDRLVRRVPSRTFG